MAKLKVKIYAERNTGSRYLAKLLWRNLDVTVLRWGEPRGLRKLIRNHESLMDIYWGVTFRQNLGWKHRLAPSAEELKNVDISHVLFLTLTKNPYSWLLSLYRRPHNHEKTWDDFNSFLRSPWQPVGRENHAGPFQNPIVMWNEKNRAYLKLNNFATACNLRYEDLLAKPEAVIDEIALKYNVPRRFGLFVNVIQSTKKDYEKDFDYYQRYYLEEKWKDKLDSSTLTIINQYLDHDLVTKFGYNIVCDKEVIEPQDSFLRDSVDN
ncbi:MAG: hypothetical protein H6632_11045 [Anaerolineales bacterium]|nr:hypothetical protein [Anaerolineales bacterium]